MSPQAPKLRGLSRDKEISSQELYRDLRTPMQKIGDALADSPGPSIAIALILLPIAFISTTFFVLVCVPIIYWATGCALGKEQKLPMLLPKEADLVDGNDPKPSRAAYYKSRGEFMLGNLRGGKRPYELWLSFNHLLTHCLILGSTGSGKSETLLSMVSNYLAVGSGNLYSDAKASAKLSWQVFALARYFGRDDDFRVLSYLRGTSSKKPDRAVRRGNTVNLFAYGSAESITQILISLIPPGGSENKLFSERAISLISSIMPALVDLRDKAGLKITPAIIRKALELEEVQKLKRAKPITPEAREAIRAYLTSLPGYTDNPKDRNGNPTSELPQETTRQHGFSVAYFTRALATLSDTYADIYMVENGEISFLDLVLRRRLCVVLIPALELAPDEMKNLGKIVLAAQKNAISTGLPPDIEGRKENVLGSLPTSAPTPYGIIIDEAAFQLTPGVAVLAAQARSLYISMCYAGQDYAGFRREDPDEAEQIAENTKLKIVMQSEGLGATRELIKEIAGEGVAATASSFAVDEGSLSHMYRDSRSANFERKERVDTQDTRSSVEGEGIAFWRDNIVPLNMFYHGMDEDTISDDLYVHRLLEVKPPTRGIGVSIFQKDSLMLASMRRAVNEGLDLGLSSADDLPDFSSDPEHPLHRTGFVTALAQWRQSLPLLTSHSEYWPHKSKPVVAEGLLAQIISTNGEIFALSENDEPDMPDGQIAGQQPQPVPAAADVPVATMAASPERAQPSLQVASFDDPASLRKLLQSDMPSEPPSSPTPKPEIHVGTPERAKPEPASQQAVAPPATQKSQSEPLTQQTQEETPLNSGSGLVDSAPWLLNPNQLANRANRPIHQGEVDFALHAAGAVNRLEQAIGSSSEDAKRVSWETSHAIIKALNYPADENSTPAKPNNEFERGLVVRDSVRTVSKMRNWLDQQ